MENDKEKPDEQQEQQQQNDPATPPRRRAKQGQRANATVIEAFDFLLKHVAVQSPREAAKANQLRADIAKLAEID
jgi:hypothetical protein